MSRLVLPDKRMLRRRAERGTRLRCPVCGSRIVATESAPQGEGRFYGRTLSLCGNCDAIWEPLPGTGEGLLDDDGRPFPLSDPCDNCAFRPGSPEQADTAKWRETIAALKAGSQFYCHKGVPLDPKGEHGFAYPTDMRRLRPCRGFLQAWSRWMERKYPMTEEAAP